MWHTLFKNIKRLMWAQASIITSKESCLDESRPHLLNVYLITYCRRRLPTEIKTHPRHNRLHQIRTVFNENPLDEGLFNLTEKSNATSEGTQAVRLQIVMYMNGGVSVLLSLNKQFETREKLFKHNSPREHSNNIEQKSRYL